MKRILIATIIVALNGLVLSPIRCSADSLPSKKEAAAVIARAIDRLRLTMPGSPPFHFVAKLHYTVGSHAADGTYEVLWAAPDRFRL